MSRSLLHKRVDNGNVRSAFNDDVEVAKREIVIGKLGDFYSLYVYNETNDKAVLVATTSGITSDDILTILSNDYWQKSELYNRDEIDAIVNEINNSLISEADVFTLELNELRDYVNTQIVSAITEVNERIEELSAYTANFSNLQLLTEEAYYVLSETGMVRVNEDGQIDNHGKEIVYSPDIYYCIYSDESGGGDEPYDEETISYDEEDGNIQLNNSELSEDGEYIILNGVELTTDGYLINSYIDHEDSYNPEIVDGNVELDNIGLDDIQDDALLLSNATLDTENNILIIN